MQLKNIVLIGLMGSGKTTVGKAVAEQLRLDFIDLDEYIESHWGSIPGLFEKGEAYFRQVESKAVQAVGELEGAVIATGGGVVTRDENIPALKKKGLVIFLDRPLEDILADINTEHRPLLKDGKSKLTEIYRERYHLYLKACDVHLQGSNSLEDTVELVIRQWKSRSMHGS